MRAVVEARAMPIPFESLVSTTLATFAARRSLASGRLEPVADQRPARPEPTPVADGGAAE